MSSFSLLVLIGIWSNDNINADKALLAYRLFEKIEDAKNQRKAEILSLSTDEFEEESFVLYSSYYVLYIIGELAKRDEIDLDYDNFPKLWALYPESLKTVRDMVRIEKKSLIGHKDTYTHASYFASNKPKKNFEDGNFNKL